MGGYPITYLLRRAQEIRKKRRKNGKKVRKNVVKNVVTKHLCHRFYGPI